MFFFYNYLVKFLLRILAHRRTSGFCRTPEETKHNENEEMSLLTHQSCCLSIQKAPPPALDKCILTFRKGFIGSQWIQRSSQERWTLVRCRVLGHYDVVLLW